MTEKNTLPVALDVMGADNGPEVIIDGAIKAANDLGIKSILVGDEQIISNYLQKKNFANSNLITVEHAPNFISMSDSPSKVIRSKEVFSVKKSFELVKENKASAVVSPGNTGAMLAAGLSVLGKIEGISRPAIATLIPRATGLTPTVLLDSGANVSCNAEQLIQFGIMGQFYSQVLFNETSPRIGVLSNGTESSKGNDLARATAYTFSNLSDVNFIGYVEGRDIPNDVAEVVVCDGFVGNIVLKTLEGGAGLIIDSIKAEISKSLRGKIGMLFAKPIFKKLFQEKLDPSSYGGAPLLGLNGVGIVCHGSAKEKAIFNAIRVADSLATKNLIVQMSTALEGITTELDAIDDASNSWGKVSNKLEPKGIKAKTLKASPQNIK